MKERWNAMSGIEKVILILRTVISIAVIVLIVLQLTGVWDRGVNVVVPMLGVYLIVMSVQEWNERRASAVVSICLAVFIFAVCIYRLLIK